MLKACLKGYFSTADPACHTTDVRAHFARFRSWLRPSVARATLCEFKGVARYLDAVLDGRRVRAAAWSYPDPTAAYEALRDHVAFYPGRVDAAWLGDELVEAQVGDFYGGWLTSDLVGPFKGPAGTLAW